MYEYLKKAVLCSLRDGWIAVHYPNLKVLNEPPFAESQARQTGGRTAYIAHAGH